MKVLVVFLLVVLGCSLTAGRIVSKCELRDQLKSAIGNLTEKAKPKGLSVDNFMAKIVCQVEQTSGFNTSAVNQVFGETSNPSGEETEHQQSSEEDKNSEEKKGRSKSKRHRRHDERPSSQTRPAPPTAQNCTLYGVFQLSSCLACNASVTPSANICGTDCSNFLDDNISDDISCLLKIPLSPENCPVVQKKCKDLNTSVYFSGCP